MKSIFISAIIAFLVTSIWTVAMVGLSKHSDSEPKQETIDNVMSAREVLIIGDIVAETWADSVQVMGRDSSGSLVVHVFMPNREVEIYGVK